MYILPHIPHPVNPRQISIGLQKANVLCWGWHKRSSQWHLEGTGRTINKGSDLHGREILVFSRNGHVQYHWGKPHGHGNRTGEGGELWEEVLNKGPSFGSCSQWEPGTAWPPGSLRTVHRKPNLVSYWLEFRLNRICGRGLSTAAIQSWLCLSEMWLVSLI